MTRILVLQLGLVIMLVMPSRASAGGWAVVVLDEVPGTLTSGVTYRVGFTVLQHGATPANGLRPAIGITAAGSRQSLEFAAYPDDAPGHYVAEVRFPAAGEWSWEVRPGAFAVQQLGSVRVAAPGGRIDTQPSPAEPAGATEIGGVSLLDWGLLPFALSAVVAAFALPLLVRLVRLSGRPANG